MGPTPRQPSIIMGRQQSIPTETSEPTRKRQQSISIPSKTPVFSDDFEDPEGFGDIFAEPTPEWQPSIPTETSEPTRKRQQSISMPTSKNPVSANFEDPFANITMPTSKNPVSADYEDPFANMPT